MQIIENNKEEKDKFAARYHGGQTTTLTQEHIQALIDGKCLALDVMDEYHLFIVGE